LPSRIRNKEAKPKVEVKSYKDVSKLHTFHCKQNFINFNVFFSDHSRGEERSQHLAKYWGNILGNVFTCSQRIANSHSFQFLSLITNVEKNTAVA